jgi:hypothetical protein
MTHGGGELGVPVWAQLRMPIAAPVRPRFAIGGSQARWRRADRRAAIGAAPR